MLAKQRRLIVSTPQQTGPVQGHRRDNIGVFQDIGPGASHPTGKSRRRLGAVGMFELQDKGARPLVVGQHRPGALEQRRLANTGAAIKAVGILMTVARKFKRQAAQGALGLADKGHPLPAIQAQRALFFDQRAAAQALRRQQNIQRLSPKPAQGRGESGFNQGPCMCHISSMSETMTVFNRRTVRQHRERAAARLEDHDFLFRETAERLCDRLDDIRRAFPVGLDLGCRTGGLSRVIGRRGGIETLFACDLSLAMSRHAGPRALVADEEFLPFGPNSFDLVLSNLSLHWVNDLPGALAQIRRCLKPGGLFLGAMLGGETLKELRHALARAEADIDGGLSPRISPFADVKDAGNLLLRAGFSLPVADMESISVSYPDPFKLMADLRGMGESNAVIEARKGFTSRQLMMQAAQRYVSEFGDDDNRIPATFQVITLTAWAENDNNNKG